MFIELANFEIERFLASSEPEVLCITGKWGVGKTYTLNRITLLARANHLIALQRYAYVSLYGMTSLEDLKSGIVEQTLPLEKMGSTPTVETVLADPRGSVKLFARKALPFISWIPGMGDVAHLVRSLSFLNVQEQIVCLDDLERKGDSLKIKEVFGLASVLKEQRRCKVILISNDDAFDGSEKEDFATYFEKTVDSYVTFAPSSQECANISLPENDATSIILRESVAKLGLSNIRLIRRIGRLANMIMPTLSKYDDTVGRRFLASLVILGWARYGDPNEAPTIDFLRSWQRYKQEKREPTDAEKQWGAKLAVYNQGIFLEEDEILWRGVCQGFFELSAIDKEAKIIHDRMSDYESRAAFSAPWRLYHDTFDSNDSEFASALYSSFKANVQQISVGNADGAICILRDLGRTELASELVAYFLASRSDDLVFDSSNLFRPIEDTEFAKAVSLRLADKVDDRTLIDILLHIVKNSGWGPAEEKKLASCTTEDYYSAFKEYRDELLTSVVQVPLTYGFKDAQIRERATAALKRIAEESALNRLRVIKKFGIDL